MLHMIVGSVSVGASGSVQEYPVDDGSALQLTVESTMQEPVPPLLLAVPPVAVPPVVVGDVDDDAEHATATPAKARSEASWNASL
jgi:hypothetical protein